MNQRHLPVPSQYKVQRRRANFAAVLPTPFRTVYVLLQDDGHGDVFEIAVHCTHDGAHALAFVSSMPVLDASSFGTWGETLLQPSGQLDLSGHWQSPVLAESTLTLGEVLIRARAWCVAYHHFLSTGDSSRIGLVVCPFPGTAPATPGTSVVSK